MTVDFVITDTAKDVRGQLHRHPSRPVQGGQGRGRAGQAAAATAHFVATEVLAKHDENYMPPEAQHAVDQANKAAKTLK